MRISDWSSDVCSSDLDHRAVRKGGARPVGDALAHQCDGCGPCNARGASGHAWAPGRTHRQYREHGVAEGLCLYERLYGLEACGARGDPRRSEEHTSELQSLMRISYAVFCLKKKTTAKK